MRVPDEILGERETRLTSHSFLRIPEVTTEERERATSWNATNGRNLRRRRALGCGWTLTYLNGQVFA